ncbi:MAG: hypothetical protein IJW43_04080 [Clostridia bacterium]|nr:hypothetical protein [Clostridia bacterium]
MFDKRITLVMGHYGSGKTTVAVNYAKALKKIKQKVSIYDLDIVNPYYRTVDAISILEESGVELVVSPFAETNVDIPAMNSKSYKMVDDKESFAVVDVGGDDRGALALGRFSSKIKEENDYDCLLVVNKYRPETRDVEGVKAILNEIEIASRIKFTGLVNNSNLGKETTEKEIYEGFEFCSKLSKELNLPIKFTAVEKHLVEKIKDIKNVLPVDCIKYGDWL